MTSSSTTPEPRTWPLLMCAWLLLLVIVKLVDLAPPGPVKADAPPEQFSAMRARADLEVLTRAPRPSGTPEHRAAREYLLRRLGELGLKGEVQSTSVVGTWWGLPYDAAHVDNVLARLPGTRSTGVVLLMAHYDSVPHSPGAGDDASGVAVLLETLRALRTGAALRNDLVVLFTDAEEAGALGAQAFHAQHPWAREVGVVLNFDSRGSGGATAIYETSQGNAHLVEAVARAVPQPLASSLFQEVARRLGHATDLRVFREAGLPSLNIGFTDATSYYHTRRDGLASLDLGSVQHMGAYALSLGRELGGMDLRQLPSDDAVYFDVFLGRMVRYPSALALPLAAALLLAYGAVVLRARSMGRATLRGISGSALGFLASIALVTASGWGLLFVLRRADPVLALMREPYEATGYRLGLACTAAGLSAALYCFARRRWAAQDLALGALLVWSVGLGVSSVLAPGASYYFAWPLAGALVGLAAGDWAWRTGRPFAGWVLVAASAVPVVAIALPGPYLLFVALQMKRGAFAVAAVALLMGALLPQLERLGAGRSLRPASALALAGLAMLCVARARSGFSAEQPRPAGLSYAVDHEAGRAYWVTTDAEPPSAHARYFSTPVARPERDLLNPYDADLITHYGSAPVEALPPPAAELLQDERSEGGRRLQVKVRSVRQAPELWVFVASESRIRGARIDGRDVEQSPPHASDPRQPWGFHYLGTPQDGITLVLDVADERPVELRITDRTYALPAPLVSASDGADLMSVPFYLAGSTFGSQSFRF